MSSWQAGAVVIGMAVLTVGIGLIFVGLGYYYATVMWPTMDTTQRLVMSGFIMVGLGVVVAAVAIPYRCTNLPHKSPQRRV